MQEGLKFLLEIENEEYEKAERVNNNAKKRRTRTNENGRRKPDVRRSTDGA